MSRVRGHFPKRLGILLLAGTLAANTLLVIPSAQAADLRPLVKGDRGPAIIELQTRLKVAALDPGPVDGIYGSRTDTAVRTFQGARSLSVTGVVDAATWAALGGTANPVLNAGDRGSRVLELQRQLLAAGHNPGPLDGIYGSKTTAAVTAWQRAVALPITGEVDQAAWDRLFTSTVLLRRGSTGSEVVEVQTHLTALGYPAGTIDGKFGLLTEAAVRAFQSSYALSVTGEVDLTTRETLRREDTGPGAILLERGDGGPAVLALQTRLARVGFSPGSLDGGYGDRTVAAVDRFQNTFRLPGDGAFNEVTDKRLTAFQRDAERGYAAGYAPGGGAEQWRDLVIAVFTRWGLDAAVCADASDPSTCVPGQIDAAIDVMYCESKGIPFAVNVTSGVTGLYQHRMTYWAERVNRVRAHFSDFPSDASPYEPEHNIMIAALLVWESRNALVRNLAAGRSIDDGPHPWSHWSCQRAIG